MSKEDTGNAKQPDPVADEQLENKANNEAPEKKGNDSSAEDKEKQKLQMELNMLRNKLDEKERSERKREEEEMKEREEFRTLYERTKAQLEELETEQETKARKEKLKKEQSNLLSDYSDDVREAAEEVGLSLSDTTEEAQKDFRKRVDAIAKRLGGEKKVTPNNPGEPQRPSADDARNNYVRNPNDKNFNDWVSNHPAFKKANEQLGRK